MKLRTFNFKRFFLGLFLLCLLAGGMSYLILSPVEQIQKKYLNLILVTDLSDRLYYDSLQIKRDLFLINSIFKLYESRQRREGYINAKDEFKFFLARQRGNSDQRPEVTNELCRGYNKMDISSRTRARFDQFKTKFFVAVDSIYQDATEGKTSPSQYQGADIWDFVFNNLENECLPTHENIVIFLTDGYVDFEAGHREQQSKGLRNSTSFLPVVRNDNWRQMLDNRIHGLIPTHNKIKFTAIVLEISPKSDYVFERPILEYVWRNWLSDCGADTVVTLNKVSTSTIESKLKEIVELKSKAVSAN